MITELFGESDASALHRRQFNPLVEDDEQIYCFLEFADHGQLFAYLKATGMVQEPLAAETGRGRGGPFGAQF